VVNGRVPTEDVEGVVESVNRTGLKIAGSWVNLSQFGPKLELPDAGAHVRLSVDSRGYIKTLEVLDGPPSDGGSQRDKTITRLAVLKAAAEFVGLWGQTRPEVTSDHVLVLANKWLEWVKQP